jgi:hypothetical protein
MEKPFIPKLKNGDKVILKDCAEASIYKDKVFTCRGDSFISMANHEVAFLQEKAGYWDASYLQKLHGCKSCGRTSKVVRLDLRCEFCEKEHEKCSDYRRACDKCYNEFKDYQKKNAVKSYIIPICDDCINLKGEMCNNPHCAFIRKDMKEVKELLDILLIRPIINGEQTEDICRTTL